MAVERRIRRLCGQSVWAWLVLLWSPYATAHPICIHCSEPQVSLWCDIDRSNKIENLPFGGPLLERACAKLLKTSKGVHGCKASEDLSCNGMATVTFTLSDVKQVALAKTPPSTKVDTVATKKDEVSTEAQPTPNPLASAWHKFIALLTGN